MKKGLIILLLFLLASGTVYGRDGEMLEFRIKDPVAYPGTERTIKVYVPGCYTGDIPACLLVMMDGVRHDAPMVMDELMAEGAVPVTISMFIEPGKIYSPDGNVIRYNRSNEFDRTDGRLADFIENEVFPQAERLVTSDGRKVRISRNATDRAVTGDSSGGIAAFSAAWNRPDLFSRVYSIVGTFIPFRGGDQFPVLIRRLNPSLCGYIFRTMTMIPGTPFSGAGMTITG